MRGTDEYRSGRQKHYKGERIDDSSHAWKTKRPAAQLRLCTNGLRNVFNLTKPRQCTRACRPVVETFRQGLLDEIFIMIVEFVDGATHVPRGNAGSCMAWNLQSVDYSSLDTAPVILQLSQPLPPFSSH